MVLAAAAGVTGDGAVVRGAAEELREGVLGVLEGAALDRELLFSGGFASWTCNRAGESEQGWEQQGLGRARRG